MYLIFCFVPRHKTLLLFLCTSCLFVFTFCHSIRKFNLNIQLGWLAELRRFIPVLCTFSKDVYSETVIKALEAATDITILHLMIHKCNNAEIFDYEEIIWIGSKIVTPMCLFIYPFILKNTVYAWIFFSFLFYLKKKKTIPVFGKMQQFLNIYSMCSTWGGLLCMYFIPSFYFILCPVFSLLIFRRKHLLPFHLSAFLPCLRFFLCLSLEIYLS